MKITFRRGRKIGDPGYSSTDVGMEIVADCDDELYYDRPAEFGAWAAKQFEAVDELLEAEIRRIYSTRPAPVETAAQRDRANGNGNGTGNGYHADGDREIDRARARDEPRNGNSYRNGDGASAKPRYEWDRRGDRPESRDRDRPRDDRGGRRDDRAGEKSYGPPRTGAQLFAWAKGEEERGADGFVKALGGWCKKHELPWRFNDLSGTDVREVYEAGRAMLEDAGGY